MSEIDLDAIRARADAATEGPWEAEGSAFVTSDVLAEGVWTGTFTIAKTYEHVSNAEFIAHAREDIPALLALVDALTDERDRA